ncbi:response regulator transcription factor [Alteromonas sp. RKMC-009]|uniref:response regulator transcription factor n=1 Tax=Alteromonas sp. RKMC-009 TaxID=2267264 RepID=UPI000E68FC61|nr:response regulator transcription factor [Alteromonas sp. RKMC-009]AYA63444.1 response regulator transcription factor [Alteromonas sp. RKMC-009]
MRVLLIEDSDALRRNITIGLKKLGYAVDNAATGTDGLNMALLGEYDIVILDLMLPHLDGMEILTVLRKKNIDTRVIILSARSGPDDKVNGIIAGADDYLAKPFSFDELCARMVNLMRRGKLVHSDDKVVVGDFTLDLQSKLLLLNQTPVDLTPNEYRIVECLFHNKNRIVTSERLSESIAGSYDMVSKNAIEAHLSAVRKKVRKLGGELPVKNKRGFGYMVAEEL